MTVSVNLYIYLHIHHYFLFTSTQQLGHLHNQVLDNSIRAVLDLQAFGNGMRLNIWHNTFGCSKCLGGLLGRPHRGTELRGVWSVVWWCSVTMQSRRGNIRGRWACAASPWAELGQGLQQRSEDDTHNKIAPRATREAAVTHCHSCRRARCRTGP